MNFRILADPITAGVIFLNYELFMCFASSLPTLPQLIRRDPNAGLPVCEILRVESDPRHEADKYHRCTSQCDDKREDIAQGFHI